MIDQPANFRRDAISLVAHDQNPICRQSFRINIFPFQKGSINRNLGMTVCFQEFRKIYILDFDVEDCTHTGLNHFRVENIDGIFRANDVGDPKPIGNPKNSSQILRILNKI